MIDYLMHSATLDAVLTGLGAGAGTPDLRDRLLPAALADPGAARFGSLIGHLLHHAESDQELALVRQASVLWSQALGTYSALTTAREDVESALLAPGEQASVDRFNTAIGQLTSLKTQLEGLQTQVLAMRASLMPIPYLRVRHPRQQSLPQPSWSFTDRYLARRTGALAKALVEGAPDDATLAVSAGAVAAVVGNSLGSLYLGATVGGPRRLHPVRDRLARNTVGAWCAANRPVPSLTELSQSISFGSAAGSETIPADTRQAIELALNATYPKMPAVPDLDLGLRRMTEHLRLLDTFVLPALPRPVAVELVAALILEPGTPGGGVEPQTYGDDPTGPTNSTTDPTTSDTSTSGGGACGLLLALLTLVVAGLIICIGLLISEGKCTPKRVWEVLADGFSGGEEPEPQATAQTLTAAAASGAGAELVGEFLKAQGQVWQGLSKARTFLATIGLIYPAGPQLKLPLFGQFCTTPSAGPGAWPHRARADEFDAYVFAPSTPTEQPGGDSPVSAGLTPADILERVPGWISEAVGRLFEEPFNLDLDGDRGQLHRCWDLTSGTHISDPVLSVRILAYDEL